MNRGFHPVLVCGGGLLALVAASTCRAGTENGNDLCLEFATAEGDVKDQVQEQATGKLFFFRYLRIVEIDRGDEDGRPYVDMQTVEPSSEAEVNFRVRKKVSLKKAASLQAGDAVAVTGRVQSMTEEPDRVVLDPVIVRYKDRLSPKTGKELLYEVDPDARRGTDTSTGAEEVLRGRGGRTSNTEQSTSNME